MNNEELTLERAGMTQEVMLGLQKNGWKYTQEITGSAMIFHVTHPDLPGWTKEVSIEQVHVEPSVQVNVLIIRGVIRSQIMSKASVSRMMAKLERIKRTLLMVGQSKASFEELARQYVEKQARDLAQVEIPDWVNVEIRTMGELAGRYKVSFDAGSLIEHLSVPQTVALLTVLGEIEADQKKQEEGGSGI
jgi:hypothetical protein